MKFATSLTALAAVALLSVGAAGQIKIKGTIKPDPNATPTPTPTGGPIKIAPSQPGGRPPGPNGQPANGGPGIPGGGKIVLPMTAKFNAMLAQPFGAQPFQWHAGQAPAMLPLAATHICLLSGVSGDFAGDGERIALYIDNGAPGGPRWTLNGTSGQPQLRATATCVAKSRFVPTLLNPGQMTVVAYPHQVNGGCGAQYYGTPDSFASRAFFISGMAGKFRGDGEMVAATGGNGKGGMRLIGCSGFVDGTVMSVGDVTVPLVKYRTRSDRTNKMAAATFAISQANESSSALSELFGGPPFLMGGGNTWLTPVDEAICGLVTVRGQFQGYGESLEIVAMKNSDGRWWWNLKLGNMANGGVVTAAARCLARDQR